MQREHLSIYFCFFFTFLLFPFAYSQDVPSVVSETISYKTLAELETAFAMDNYTIVKTVYFQGKKGVLACHHSAFNYETKEKKKVLYVEGNGYQMGYLIGLLAYDDVEKMTTKFVDRIIFDFIDVNLDPDKIAIIWAILKQIISNATKKVIPDIPQAYIDEMNGLVDGCKAANPNTKVCFEDMCILNVGVDCLLATIYAVNNVWERDTGIKAEYLRLPVMCNAFSVFGHATRDGKHYFGRDFMFATASVFEYTACKIIYCPSDGRIPMVSVSAPGFVGSIAGMNKDGIAIGVDMSPSGNCDPSRPGINSLLLVRHSTHEGASAQDALNTMVQAQRGVSWDYIVADGKNNRSLVAESGMKTASLDFLKYPPTELKEKKLLPDQTFLDYKETQSHQNGIMVRWNDYVYPTAFLEFNKALFERYGKTYNPADWGERGYINKVLHGENCPLAYYFAPQRENKDDVLIVTNHYVVPSMRLCAMNPCTVVIAMKKVDDIQWRYDELNNQVLSAYGAIDFAKALEIIDFLSPYRKFPEYYKDNKTSTDGKAKVIGGSVSVCNLTDKIIQSHFGFYNDEWITITLPNYVN